MANAQKELFPGGASATFLEALEVRYRRSPEALDPRWRDFFAQMGSPNMDLSVSNGALIPVLFPPPGEIWPLAEKVAQHKPQDQDVRAATLDSVRALMMIRAYRVRGHLAARLDPLALKPPESHPELDPVNYGFRPQDWDRPIFIDHVLGLETATVRQIMEILKRTYSHTLGFEFMHISSPQEKAWVQEHIEGPEKVVLFTPEGKRAILWKLWQAEAFEKFLAVKYTGTKRFGLDGAEAVIPALEGIIKRGGALGVREINIGMAHRGRLNVLANVMDKPYRSIFHEFHGGASHPEEVEGSGDVKYHLGVSSERVFDDNHVHLSLLANPSHLESVDPVVLGKVRARQDKAGDHERHTVVPLLLHGDAAFAGQGVVAECFGLSGLRGHRSGGSIHFIINNQIGFTTTPLYARSSPYPSDVAKMVEAPIFHVNGDDPEAVVFAAKLAMEFRQEFHKPVVVDMFCYRRFGHNESDEPMFTQPFMYKKIHTHPPVTQLYTQTLLEEGVVSEAEVQAHREELKARLSRAFEGAEHYTPQEADFLSGHWRGLRRVSSREEEVKTGVPQETLKVLGGSLTTVPEGFTPHRTVRRLLETRRQNIDAGGPIDWATAEAFAFASLLAEGTPVRLSGQDSERGTFSQRHVVLVDQHTEERFIPLSCLEMPTQAKFEVVNSMLSELAVLGFEYGYSLSGPKTLTLWEAQFGDFANGAQVIVDQFISSAQSKWLRMSGLVLLLPHGYEGQGPEHSSARLERYLQLCAEDNMQVANCTTPANYFHILRRQMHRDFRTPLILMTPKSLLRHKACVSPLAAFSDDRFRPLIEDGGTILVSDEKIRRLIICSGKVYYDLTAAREGIEDIYLLRLEQLYPFPTQEMERALKRFPDAELVWCQEEPQNMGGWSFVRPLLEALAGRPVVYVGRPAAASPAVGTLKKHQKQLRAFLGRALSQEALV